MDIDNFKDRMYTRSNKELLHSHLEDIYGVQIKQLTKLALDVFKVEGCNGQCFVARQFPKARTFESVKRDAKILYFLEQQGYPAERCAYADAVSVLEDKGVLLTNFVQGSKLKGTARAYYFLGTLLGRLHSIGTASSCITWKGGAWHHLAVEGGPREEIDATLSLLINSEQGVPIKQRSQYELLLNELLQIKDIEDMPQALIHPDFVPGNMIKLDVGNWTVIDWAGTGLGPRIWPLGFLLWAAGNRDLQCIDAVVTGYRKYVKLDADELERLLTTIGIRPLIFISLNFSMGRKGPSDAIQELFKIHNSTQIIAKRTAQAFK